MEKKKTTWTKTRHRVITALVRPVLAPYCWLRYHIHVEKFREQGNRPYLILYNHQTGFDQFFVALAFRGPVYYLATEDIFSLGWISTLLRWLVAPIPIRKQTTDITAVMNCIKVAREGGSLCIAPEGNRTYSGRTEYMSDSIASLAKKLKRPIALYRIEGGYGVQPRWSDVRRKGRMKAYVSCVLEPEEYKSLSNEELYQRICKELYQNEANSQGTFVHKKSAEYIERVLYVCPHCGITHFESNGETFRCTSCGRSAKYLPNKEISGDFSFRYMLDWYEYQEDYINQLNTAELTQAPLIKDTCSLYSVELYKGKRCLGEHVELALYGDRIEVSGDFRETFPFADVETITILGKNKLDIYYHDMVYQIQSDKRFNALKYLNLYHRYKNLTTEVENGSFLGL